jgi:peptidylprolyl isomerase
MEFPETGPVYIWVKEDGQVGYLRFTNITPETTTIDENHPLAGKDLVFEITLVEIVEKTEQ